MKVFFHGCDYVVDIIYTHERVAAPIEAAIHNPISTCKVAAQTIYMMSERWLTGKVSANDRPRLNARGLQMVAQAVAHVTRAAKHRIAEGRGRHARIVPN